MNLLPKIWPLRHARRFGPVVVHDPCFVIGDVHGMLPLLQRLIAQAPTGAEVICVGDYIDRGPDSAGVLRLLFAQPNTTCIVGNHEVMLLNFINNPTLETARWFRFGGLQTLESFGIIGASDVADEPALQQIAHALRDAMGPDLIAWLQGLPHSVMRGNVLITHAGADPAKAPHQQPPKGLTWGHPTFRKRPRKDGVWVLHGHTVMNIPEAHNGIISIDTGAYATGRLTAAILDADGCRFTDVDQANGH